MTLRLRDFGLPMGYKHKVQKLTAEYKETFLAEKGGSRTLRGPYGPQTGFEDQRHHRAPSFSMSKIMHSRAYCGRVATSCLAFLSTTSIFGPVPNAVATPSL